MDIVRITLKGYGCEVGRGIITKEQKNKLEKSKTLDNIWVKGLYKHIGKKWKRIELSSYDYGIISGDIIVTLNNQTILDLPTTVLGMDLGDQPLLVKINNHYPETENIVMTTLQHEQGVIADIMFITENFDISKLVFTQKDIHNSDNDVIIGSLISEISYDGVVIPFTGSETELRLSNVYFNE